MTGPRGPGPRAAFARYLSLKAGGAGLSLFVVLLLGFFLFRIIPGDPVQTLTRGRPTSRDQLAGLRRSLGLDDPLWLQFWHYLRDTVTGDLGTSWQYQSPVTSLIGERLWPTVLLVGTATALSAGLGLWVGVRSGWRQGSLFDRSQTGLALALWSMPTFWLGLVLLVVLGVGIGPVPGMFPSGGMQSPDAGPGTVAVALDVAHHLVLPCLTMVAVLYAQYLLVMRSSLLDELGSDYVTTARAKGLRDAAVRTRHAVPNAMLPTVTLVFLHLGTIVAGAITVETVYSWPGLGYLTYQALNIPDLPLLQGTFLVFSASVIVMNLVADLLYRLLDPRVRSA